MSLNVPNLSGNISSGESFLEETMVSFREVTPDKTQNLVKNAIPLPVSETPGKLSADVVHVLDTRIVMPQTQTVSNFTLDRNEDSKYIPPARAPQPSSYYSSQTSSSTDSRGTSDLRGAPIPPADTIEVTHKFDIELPAKYPISPPTITLPEGTVRSDKHAANDEKVAKMQKEIDHLRDEVLSANRRLEELNSQLTTKDALAKGFMTRIEGLEKDLHTRDMDWRHEKQCAMELRERLLQSDRRLESDRSHHEELLKKKSHEIEKLKRMNQILDNDRLELEVKLMQLKQREDKERTPSGSGMSTKQGAGSSPRSSMKQEPSSPTGSLSKPFIPEPASPLSRTQSLRQFSQETSAPPSRAQSSKNLQRESSLSSNQSNSKTSFQRETSSPPSRTQSSKALREASSSQPPTSAKRDVTCRTPSTKSCSETSAIVEDLTQQVHAMEVLRQQRATLENEVAVLKQHLIEARQRMLCLRPLEEECVELRQQIEQKNMRLNDYERKSTALNEQLHSQCEKHDQTLENLKLHQELLHRSTFLAITLAPLENGVYDGNRIHYHAPTQPLTVKETENVLNALESEMSKRPGSVQVHPRRGTPQLTATHLAPTTAARLWPPKRSTRSEAGGSNAVTPGTRSPRSGSGEYGSPSAVVPDSLIPGISSDAAVGNGALQLHLPSPYQIFASTTNRTYNLPRKGAILLGAAEDCDIEVPGKYVDPYHAIIICTPHSVPRIADLGARKGTYVNGQRVGIPVRLHPGTRFTVGNIAHTFCVQFVGSDSVIQLSPLDVSSNLPNTTRTPSLSGASQGTLQAYRRYTSDASLRSSQQPTPYSSHMNPVPVSKNGSAIQTERTLVAALRGPADVYRTRVVRPKSSGLGRISSRSVPLRTSRVTRSVQPNDKATSTSRSRSTAAIAAMNRVPASRYPSTANRGIRSSSQHISVS